MKKLVKMMKQVKMVKLVIMSLRSGYGSLVSLRLDYKDTLFRHKLP